MQTVQLTALSHSGHTLFFCLGMGTSYAAAKAAAYVGVNARLEGDRKLSRRVAMVEAEVL